MSAEDYEQLWILLVMLPSAAALFNWLGTGTAGMANARNVYCGQHGVAAALGTPGSSVRGGRYQPGHPKRRPKSSQTALPQGWGWINGAKPLAPARGQLTN